MGDAGRHVVGEEHGDGVVADAVSEGSLVAAYGDKFALIVEVAVAVEVNVGREVAIAQVAGICQVHLETAALCHLHEGRCGVEEGGGHFRCGVNLGGVVVLGVGDGSDVLVVADVTGIGPVLGGHAPDALYEVGCEGGGFLAIVVEGVVGALAHRAVDVHVPFQEVIARIGVGTEGEIVGGGHACAIVVVDADRSHVFASCSEADADGAGFGDVVSQCELIVQHGLVVQDEACFDQTCGSSGRDGNSGFGEGLAIAVGTVVVEVDAQRREGGAVGQGDDVGFAAIALCGIHIILQRLLHVAAHVVLVPLRVGERPEVGVELLLGDGLGVAFRSGGVSVGVVGVLLPAFAPFIPGRRQGGAVEFVVEEEFPASQIVVLQHAAPLAVGVVEERPVVLCVPTCDLEAEVVVFQPIGVGAGGTACHGGRFGGDGACHCAPVAVAVTLVGVEQFVNALDEVEVVLRACRKVGVVLAAVVPVAVELLEQGHGIVGECLTGHVKEVVVVVVTGERLHLAEQVVGGFNHKVRVVGNHCRTPCRHLGGGEAGLCADDGFGSALLTGGAVIDRLIQFVVGVLRLDVGLTVT